MLHKEKIHCVFWNIHLYIVYEAVRNVQYYFFIFKKKWIWFVVLGQNILKSILLCLLFRKKGSAFSQWVLTHQFILFLLIAVHPKLIRVYYLEVNGSTQLRCTYRMPLLEFFTLDSKWMEISIIHKCLDLISDVKLLFSVSLCNWNPYFYKHVIGVINNTVITGHHNISSVKSRVIVLQLYKLHFIVPMAALEKTD